MGFPSLTYDIVVPNPVANLLNFLARIKLVAVWISWHLGLFDPSDPHSWFNRTDHFPAMDLPPVMPPATAEFIKKRLPVMEFGCFVERSGALEEEPTCAVCLCGLERGEEIRELRNCCHVFHRGCLDKWVDLGQRTCPLCRSELLPEKGAGNGREESWVVDRISYLFGEDLVRDRSRFSM